MTTEERRLQWSIVAVWLVALAVMGLVSLSHAIRDHDMRVLNQHHVQVECDTFEYANRMDCVDGRTGKITKSTHVRVDCDQPDVWCDDERA